MDIKDFHNRHTGETCLLVGNGPNLALTPPEWFGFPAFGMNTIHLYEGWKPTYYTGVDSRLMREFGKAVYEKFREIPKFVPTPNLDEWRGDSFYRFYFRPGPLWPGNQQRLWPSGLLTEAGISYNNVMHVAMQLAYYMGFTTLLMIGVSHQANHGRLHFWGSDDKMPANYPVPEWFEGYKILADGMAEQGVKVLNISEDTYVSDSILPRDDYRKWSTHHESENATILLRG